MLLRGDITMTIQAWGPTLRHAGSKMGLASDGPFSSRVAHAAFDSKQVQTRLLHFCIMEVGDAYRSENKDRIPAKQIYVQPYDSSF